MKVRGNPSKSASGMPSNSSLKPPAWNKVKSLCRKITPSSGKRLSDQLATFMPVLTC